MKKQISLQDIDHNLDGGNMSGIIPQLIYGYQEDVDVWPAEPAATVVAGEVTVPLTLDASATLTGDLVMKTGTRAFKLDFTEETGNLKIAPVGEIDGEHFEYTLALIKAKITKTILGFMNAGIERKMFFIVPDENGNQYLMGDKRRGCTFVTGGDGATTGTTSGDRNQTSISFKYRRRKAFVYEGDVEDMWVIVP